MATFGAQRPGVVRAARKKPLKFAAGALTNRKFSGAAPQAGFKVQPGGGSVVPRLGARPPAKPPVAKPAGPRPARPAGARPANVPPDSAYNQQVATINRGEQNQLTQLQGQAQQTKFNFGIDDPTNPFSRAEGLKQAYLANLKGTSASLASQGHLYSGQHERALSRVRFNQERDYASLRQAYMDALGQIGGQQANVQTQSELQRDQAFADWLARAPDNAAPLPTDAPKPAGGPPAGGGPAQGAPKKGMISTMTAQKLKPALAKPGAGPLKGTKIAPGTQIKRPNDPTNAPSADYGKRGGAKVKPMPRTRLKVKRGNLFGRKLPRGR